MAHLLYCRCAIYFLSVASFYPHLSKINTADTSQTVLSFQPLLAASKSSPPYILYNQCIFTDYNPLTKYLFYLFGFSVCGILYLNDIISLAHPIQHFHSNRIIVAKKYTFFFIMSLCFPYIFAVLQPLSPHAVFCSLILSAFVK